MPFYENIFIARQDISAQQAEALAEQFSTVITEKGGKVEKQEHWGLRNLAFRIKKNRKGHYVRLNIDASAEAVQEMERQMRLNEDVIRQLTVRVEELDDEQAALLQSRGSRDDRGGRGGRDRDRERPRDSRPRESETPRSTESE